MTEPQSDIPIALDTFGADAAKVERALNSAVDGFRNGNGGRPVFSPLLIELMEASWLVASVDLGLSQIRSGAMLLAFLRKARRLRAGRLRAVVLCDKPRKSAQGLREDSARI